ncbi:uncharacterized protein LOC134463980 [Engraulis encrasicolus]|uniref:uncharacterized protein LOC134452106 n=1 Tax=Engraulis encrasicolus TaxID=184585 RepID=UPI002FD22E4C
MAVKRAAKLLVFLSEDDKRKMLLPNGIPESVDQLVDDVREACGLRGNFRIQYQDKDFGDIFVNLTSTTELEDLCTIKVIPLPDDTPPEQTAVNVSCCSDDAVSGSISGDTDDTLILSSPTSGHSSRAGQWPKEFPVPSFSYDTEVQLERGNAAFKAKGTRLTVGPRMKSDILEKLSDQIYMYKAYPNNADVCEVSEALIKKHPCLAEPGSWNGCYGWTQRLKTKMGNLRTHLKGLGCPELAVNSLKTKATADAYPAKNVKRPKRGEANHVPSYPVGETADNLEMERQVLLKEVKKRNNGKIVREKMAKTFALRRQEIVEKQPRVEELQERWPAMFQEDEINAEFLRITTVPLQARFFAGLDKKSSQLLQVLRKKGGAIGEKIRDVLKPLDQGVDLNRRRECILKSLVIYLGEEVGHLIKEYLVVQKEEAEAELQNAAMAIFVLRDDDLSPPQDITLVIDGVEVLNNLVSIASACAMLFGLTYAVNLSYPLELKYTFETFQKIIMDIESRQMSKRVQNLSAKLQD